MKKNRIYQLILGISLLFTMTLINPAETQAAKNEPNVFVHGMNGFAQGDLGNVNYWGGATDDILKTLNQKGYTSLEAVVSPLGSNWDRAIELYYYIKGGTVDYGEAHAAKYGHERFGRTFPGIYPNWDGQNKIHLIGHSQGGQTSRLLEALLREGSGEEQAFALQNGTETADLFKGGKNWVRSVTTLATPHNGTPLATKTKNMISDTLYATIAAAGSNKAKFTLDLKLDQWGLRQKAGESDLSYVKRVLGSNIWKANEDIVLHDLSIKGAEELNEQTSLSKDVYYFSFSGNATYQIPFTNYYSPSASMLRLYQIPGIYMGTTGSKEWRANDGLVPVISATAPFNQTSKKADGKIQPGIWYVEKTIQGWDHSDFVKQDIIQAPFLKKAIPEFYEAIAKRNLKL